MRQLYRFVERAAIFHQIEHRQAIDNNKVVPYPLAYRAYYLNREAHTAGIVAAPFVIAMVSSPREKFINQIAL
ncbi:Uncharacterised protein [Salmonella enterica subsp. enterica serovar Bovismorbificans]|uniref:Uncharacterized protein n=1 Tax=Salmonella enterica subsp. enterica serovar Bovismorbificans TaxID=58097 RepID=A0A655CNM6_SALET|nr:Uncharacterised protein [Salmonella enterica subsp. enterica serovar Bovismorbificans]